MISGALGLEGSDLGAFSAAEGIVAAVLVGNVPVAEERDVDSAGGIDVGCSEDFAIAAGEVDFCLMV